MDLRKGLEDALLRMRKNSIQLNKHTETSGNKVLMTCLQHFQNMWLAVPLCTLTASAQPFSLLPIVKMETMNYPSLIV